VVGLTNEMVYDLDTAKIHRLLDHLLLGSDGSDTHQEIRSVHSITGNIQGIPQIHYSPLITNLIRGVKTSRESSFLCS